MRRSTKRAIVCYLSLLLAVVGLITITILRENP